MAWRAPCHDPAGHLWADLGLQSCHHQSLVCPKSPLTHQPGSQQMPAQLLESAGHPSADLGLSRPDVTIRSPPEQNNANVVPSVTSFASKTIAARWSPSTSPAACRDTVGSNVWLSAATSLKKPHWQDFCARSLKSPTLEDCGSENAHCSRLAKLQWLKVCVKKYRPVSSSFYEWLILSQIASNCTTLGYVSWIFLNAFTSCSTRWLFLKAILRVIHNSDLQFLNWIQSDSQTQYKWFSEWFSKCLTV
jgi:hypothetical protein